MKHTLNVDEAGELLCSIKHLTSELSSCQLVTVGTLFNKQRGMPSNQSLHWLLHDLQWMLHAI